MLVMAVLTTVLTVATVHGGDGVKKPAKVTEAERQEFLKGEQERQRKLPPFEPVWVGLGMPTQAELDLIKHQRFEMPAHIANAAVKRWPFHELTTVDRMPWSEWDELHFYMGQSPTKGFPERIKYLISKMSRLQELGVADMSNSPAPTMEDEARQYVLKLFVGPAMTWQLVNELTTELLILCKQQLEEKGYYFIKHPHDEEQYKQLKATLLGMNQHLLRYRPDSSEGELVLYIAAATALISAGYMYNSRVLHRRWPIKKKRR
jgi:hypothetical protein